MASDSPPFPHSHGTASSDDTSPDPPANRLAAEISPYLLLHQHNPVDWYPWGEEALARARELDRPIFLSIGYSTCYWCHVMERESFADPATAELMNQHFVNIKVDREERPDLDELYMAATQILTHQGGWPNSVFLTPDLHPFYAGTYFPPTPRHGLPAFRGVLTGLARAWQEHREDVVQQADELVPAMRHFLEERGEPQSNLPAAEVALNSLALLGRRFDPVHGGFGGAPKFPTPANLWLLEALADAQPEARDMLATTLDHMARGGIFDQLAGGFHRYATDEAWRVPHFEKMLYDNALLLEVYARHFARTRDPQAARVVRATVAFLERELANPDGGFDSALDAETAGHEGAYHVWTREQIEQVLGVEDAEFLAPLLGFDQEPFFERDYYVLHLPQPLAAQAARRRLREAELVDQLTPLQARLLQAREERQQPRRDDKVLTDWNGMAIGALASAGACLEDEAMIQRAARAAEFVLRELRPSGGPLFHAYRLGIARIPAFLSDYVFLVRGLLQLHRVSGAARWLEAAQDLTAEQLARLQDPEGGFCVAAAQPDLLFRSKEVFDGALPAGNGVAVLNLLALAQATGDPTWLQAAESTLRALATLIEQRPDGARTLALAVWQYHQR